MVGKEELGEVQFLLPIDVRGLDLDGIIEVEKGKIQVYGLPGGPERPPVGQNLNAPALLHFRRACPQCCLL